MKLTFIALVSLFSSAFAGPQFLENVSSFPGDRHGQFVNDTVAQLSDQSRWKVHPKDTERFSLWGVNEPIQVSVRTTFYWFKREHKFEFVNLYRNQTVRVMLVGYPNDLLYIVDSRTDISGRQLTPYTTTDYRGYTQTYYFYTNTYEKKLFLSDGSVWTLKNKDNFNFFVNGMAVYLGKNDTGLTNFIISGTEREAAWAWITQDF